MSSPFRLRWVIAAPFSSRDTETHVSLGHCTLRQAMQRLSWPIGIVVEDGERREVKLEFKRLGDFRSASVIQMDPVLAELGDIADRLSGGQHPLPAEEAIRRVERLPVDPAWKQALAGLVYAGASTPQDQSDRDALLDEVGLPPSARRPEARSGLDAFVSAVRRKPPGSARQREVREQLAHVIRRHATDVAARMLTAPSVARLEAAWRGTAPVVAALPPNGEILLDLVPATSFDDLSLEHLTNAGRDTPDLIVCGFEARSAAQLQRAAEMGEGLNAPVIAGAGDLDPSDDELAPLRPHPSGAWLCVAANDFVAHQDDSRTVFGHPALALAAMLADRFCATEGGFRSMTGRDGAWAAPGTHSVARPGTHVAIATRTSIGPDAQNAAAERGITVLGGPLDSSRIQMQALPMLGQNTTAELPQQMWIGRIVRHLQRAWTQPGDGDVAQALSRAAVNAAAPLWRSAVHVAVEAEHARKCVVDVELDAQWLGRGVGFQVALSD